MSEQEKVEHAIADPTVDYHTPMAVVDDPNLSPQDKLRILKSWKTDAQLLATAQEENMTGGEQPHLQEVALALQALEKRTGIRDPDATD